MESLYNLVDKVLIFRLSKVMDNLISSSQSTFLKGRQIVDAVMVVNELMDLA